MMDYLYKILFFFMLVISIGFGGPAVEDECCSIGQSTCNAQAEEWCEDLEYLHTYYNGTGKCPNMGCDGVCGSSTRYYVYYLDEDGDGWGKSIAGKYCENEAYTIETLGSSAASQSSPNYKVLNAPDIDEDCYCPENTDADCYDCLGNCKYRNNGQIDSNYIGDDTGLNNACPDTGRLGCNECGVCDDISLPTWYADTDADGMGDIDSPQDACNQPANYVSNSYDPEPNCSTNDTDECSIELGINTACGGDGYAALCTDIEYLHTYYNGTGKCSNMGCDGVCGSSTRYYVYYLDEDGDGWGESIAGKYCEDDPNTIEIIGASAASESAPGFKVLNAPDFDEDCYCPENTDADCYDCLGNCKYRNNGQIDSNYIGDDTGLNNACPDTGRLGCNECGDCNGDATPTWYADTDGDGMGDSTTSQQSCTQPSNYVSNSSDPEPSCATNDTDECGVCGGDNYEILCTDLEYINANYLADGKCSIMDCTGNCNGSKKMSVYYLDEDGDGWGQSIAGKYCEDDPNTIEIIGASAASESAPGFKVLNAPDIDENCYCSENTDADCYDCLGNCKYTSNGLGVNLSYIGIQSSPIDLTNACTDTGRLGCNECGECNGNATPTWYADTDGDGMGDLESSQQSCTQPSNYVSNSSDLEPSCGTNDTDECGVCGGDNYEILCTDLEYINTNYLVDGKCSLMDCSGICNGSEKMSVYYLDEDGDGWGQSIAGKYCSSDPNTIELLGEEAALVSFPGSNYPVLNHPDIDENCYCPENIDADCYDCLGNCKYRSNGTNNTEEYIGDGIDDGLVDLTNTCSDTGRLGCNECGECNGDATPTWYADIDGDGMGDFESSQQSCVQPDEYVSNSYDPDPTCITNDTDECGVCGGDNYEILCTDLEYINANYLADGKCSLMDCSGACNGSEKMSVYYLDEDGDGWGTSIAGKYCSSELNTIEETGISVTSFPGSFVVQGSDINDGRFCQANSFDLCDICGSENIDEGSCSNSDYLDKDSCEFEEEIWTSLYTGPDIDCNGVCGGVAEVDDCGVCDGNNLTKDCNGVCGGSDKFDVCGICAGSNLDESSCSDPNYTDQLSCVASEEIWSTLFSGPDVDCSGECGGIAELDDCGVCNGGNKSKDCAGVCDGELVLDDCGVCDGQNQKDLLGNCVFVIHPGDANMDQKVDVSDLNAIVANWGKRVGWKRTEIDFNGSAVFSKYDWSPQVLNTSFHINAENECLLYADANSDGKINLWDITAIYLNQGSSHSYSPLYVESCKAELSRDKEDIYFQIYNNLPDSDLKNELEKEFGFRVLPDEFKLYPNYPNPFNPSTLIHFEVPYTQSVTLEIISIKGQLIETRFFDNLEQGFYSHRWDAKDYSSGIYFSRLLVDDDIVGINKMLLVK